MFLLALMRAVLKPSTPIVYNAAIHSAENAFMSISAPKGLSIVLKTPDLRLASLVLQISLRMPGALLLWMTPAAPLPCRKAQREESSWHEKSREAFKGNGCERTQRRSTRVPSVDRSLRRNPVAHCWSRTWSRRSSK